MCRMQRNGCRKVGRIRKRVEGEGCYTSEVLTKGRCTVLD